MNSTRLKKRMIGINTILATLILCLSIFLYNKLL